MRSILRSALITTLLFSTTAATATEGMWMPGQVPALASELKAAGLKLPPEELGDMHRAPMSAIVWLGSCSASFVSPKGLVVTNHHCVLQSLQANSSAGQDYITNGLLALNSADELPAAPGTRVYVIDDIRDVTDDILAGTSSLKGAERTTKVEQNQKNLLANCEATKGFRCTVSPIYEGARYILQQMLEIRDVRLVHAPPAAIGKYGGEEDNWMWPRHTGDYSFYRAYVAPNGTPAAYSPDNVPYQPRAWLKLAENDLKDGDYVMIAGFPGTTERLRNATEAKAWYEHIYPLQQRLLSDYAALIERETQSDADRIAYASLKAGADNYKKKILGQINMAEKAGLVATKQADDERLAKWAAQSKNRQHQRALATYNELANQRLDRMEANLVNSMLDRAQLLSAARTLYRWAKEREHPDAERAPGYQDRDRQSIVDRLTLVSRQYVPRIDRTILEFALTEVEQLPEAKRNQPLVEALRTIGADTLYTETKLADLDTRLQWLDQPASVFEASDDPFIRAAIAGYDTDQSREAGARAFAGNLGRASIGWLDAMEAFAKSEGRTLYPDANRGLRFTYGHVQGQQLADGVQWTAFTTPRGLIEKESGKPPFQSPPELLVKVREANWQQFASPSLKTLPVNFLSDTDITNGNSGSAVLDTHGHLVGLAFDGTLDGMLSDWQFDPKTTRTISVDMRYVRWLMQEVLGADALLDEMNSGAE